MTTPREYGVLVSVVVFLLAAAAAGSLSEHANDSGQQDKAAIEKLHQEDVRTTLSDKADELATLWDKDAVRIEPGRPAEVGKELIYRNDKRWEASTGRDHTLCYRAEMQDLHVSGDWGYEWGYFSYKSSANGEITTGQGKVMRVMKRQPDGSWKFAAVMGYPEKLQSAAPLTNPCR